MPDWDDTDPIQKRYSSRAAALYRDKVRLRTSLSMLFDWRASGCRLLFLRLLQITALAQGKEWSMPSRESNLETRSKFVLIIFKLRILYFENIHSLNCVSARRIRKIRQRWRAAKDQMHLLLVTLLITTTVTKTVELQQLKKHFLKIYRMKMPGDPSKWIQTIWSMLWLSSDDSYGKLNKNISCKVTYPVVGIHICDVHSMTSNIIWRKNNFHISSNLKDIEFSSIWFTFYKIWIKMCINIQTKLLSYWWKV